LNETRYRAAHISELELPANPDRPEWPRWATVRHHFGISSFGVNAWTTHEAGDVLIQEHDELGEGGGGHEELYFIVNGRAAFTIDGDELAAPAGTFVFVPPDAKRKAVAEEPDTTVLAIGGKPGKAFETSPWERSAPAFAYWATGEFDKAVEFLSNALREYPDDAAIFYNLACAECRAGDTEAALDHLRRSVELDSDFAENARDDPDFDAVRSDPAFTSAIAGKVDAPSSSS